MANEFIMRDDLNDPATRALVRNRLFLRTYQSDALRTIFCGVQRQEGERFTVTFPRQSGKNETQAQLESAVMAANLYRGGSIVKLMPTEKNQGLVSRQRLESAARGGFGKKLREMKSVKDRTVIDTTQIRYLSASPNSTIVGATADLMLEVDEAQSVPSDKFDREVLPMAASTNAARVFWGTAWDDQTLLYRESKLAEIDSERDRIKRRFITDATEVGKEVPAYGEFVSGQIAAMGRDHPAVRTQFFCEEISDTAAMFSSEKLEMMRGTHRPLEMPEEYRCYVFMIDIAGSDELTASSKKTGGFTDRRDATVVTICDVAYDENDKYGTDMIWKVVARRYYRNLPAAELERQVSMEVDTWNPVKVILDHSGLGCMLSDYLSKKYPYICFSYDITAPNKTRMAWDFLAMISRRRWLEYQVDELEGMQNSDFVPGVDNFEVLKDPGLLQRMFFKELRACRMEPGGDLNSVRWGVPDGTRDPKTGKYIHDDLVMSAALSVFGKDLSLSTYNPDLYVEPTAKIQMLSIEEMKRRGIW